jgi:hypothetical protein
VLLFYELELLELQLLELELLELQLLELELVETSTSSSTSISIFLSSSFVCGLSDIFCFGFILLENKKKIRNYVFFK